MVCSQRKKHIKGHYYTGQGQLLKVIHRNRLASFLLQKTVSNISVIQPWVERMALTQLTCIDFGLVYMDLQQ